MEVSGRIDSYDCSNQMTKDKVNQSHPSDDARLGCPTNYGAWIHRFIRFDSLTAFLSRDLSTCNAL
jgi:hypothetical protein